MIYFQNIVVFTLQLIFNPMTQIPLESHTKPVDYVMNELKNEEFLKEAEKFNQDLDLINKMRNLKQTSCLKDFNRMIVKENFPKEQDEIKKMTHEFIESRLLRKNIKIEWVMQKNKTMENEKINDFKYLEENKEEKHDHNIDIEEENQNKTQEEFVEFIVKKSKSKDKMVLRERKKLSFIQFFMGRQYRSSQENTHMKRYKKIMDKNKDGLDEICVICLGIYFSHKIDHFIRFPLEKITKSLGKISCIHLFCFDCIKDWSQVTNSCPLCKKEFLEIQHLTVENKLITTLVVEPRKQRIHDDLDFEEPFRKIHNIYIKNIYFLLS